MDYLAYKLSTLGFLNTSLTNVPTDREVRLALEEYKEYHGVSEEDVYSHIGKLRYCSLPDKFQLNATICKWPTIDVKYTIVQDLPNMTHEQFKESAIKACTEWNKVCGINLQYTENPQEANIIMQTRRIDGRGGVLAESELPCGNVVRTNQWYDSLDSWILTPASTGIFLNAVICHEVGHAIGLEHSNDGGLMDPFYKPSVFKPVGRTEIQGAIQRYGKPDNNNTPIDPGSPQSDYIIRVKGTVSIDGYRLTKLV